MEVNSSPYFRVSGRERGGGGGGKCPPIVFLEEANIHHYAFVEGAIILPCQLLCGQMSTHAIFHRGADVRGGKCPAPCQDMDFWKTSTQKFYLLDMY